MLYEQGRDFAGYYYGYRNSPVFPSDIGNYALKYLEPTRYHSDEFKDEAYLFIPFDETYYQDMAEAIGEGFVSCGRIRMLIRVLCILPKLPGRP